MDMSVMKGNNNFGDSLLLVFVFFLSAVFFSTFFSKISYSPLLPARTQAESFNDWGVGDVVNLSSFWEETERK